MRTPELLRDTADFVEELGGRQFLGKGNGTQVRAYTPNDLRDIADRIEREQAERVERAAAIEHAARVLIVPQRAMTWDEAGEFERNDVRNMARALADAGLLKIDGGSTR